MWHRAAPLQVGINRRLMVYNPEGDRRKRGLEQVLVNPRIIGFGDRIIEAPEGCLSFPSAPLVAIPWPPPPPPLLSLPLPDISMQR